MKSKNNVILTILFFAALWGLSEALLGSFLYSNNVKFASVPLTIIAFVILTFARKYVPIVGVATIIAALAMLYKFFNEPFFACHLLGILMIGVCYDVFFAVLNIKKSWLASIFAVYINYILFALMITYVFQYGPWPQGGIAKIAKYILISGSMTAIGCSIIVPLAEKSAESLAKKCLARLQMLPHLTSFAMWAFAVSVFVNNYFIS